MSMKSISVYSPRLLLMMSGLIFFISMWLMYTNKMIIMEWELISMFLSSLNITIILDIKGMLFSSVVLFISGNVMMFSTLYMKEDKFIDRFTILVLLFVLSMNLLIYIPNLIILLLGWDGLGIISFILVIYYQNAKSLAAGVITIMTNRIGDVMILLSIALTLNQGHWNIMNMWLNNDIMSIQACMIMLAAMTKSAQMPFSSWLPAAMAAPTPVSALVHSSTLVTAGIFLLIRFYPFLSNLSWFNYTLLYISMMTMTMAGLAATIESDMKKIIALSTLSQLGLMMCSLGFNLPLLAYFHMVVHAMFKALLFICAGTLISSHMHSQDLRWMGNLVNQMPMTSSCIMIANLAMCGFPFLAAFYTKDMIIELSMFNMNSMLTMILLYLSLGITSFYSIRFSMYVLWSPMNSIPYYLLDEPESVNMPMFLLSISSIMSGMLLWWWYPFMDEFMNFNPNIMMVPIIMIIVGFTLAWFWSYWNKNLIYSMQNFMSYMWYLTPLTTQYAMGLYMVMSKLYLELIDQAWLEFMGGLGMNKLFIKSSNNMMKINKSNPLNYLIMSFISFSIMIFIFI
uniref:NADH-ubiquinone oxidoreductase chain 5 n=1 Tax=Baicaloclepsis echinulata TaxID=2995197 RepID=A0A9E8K361_9ANNE|nr:NADH dehydrogenase subunit 5 [Baicaloclepsis echinulata]UZT67818.1 NADH dehydrogenase subunit 5 [Baicaloclepsis echinulata]